MFMYMYIYIYVYIYITYEIKRVVNMDALIIVR